MNHRQEVAGGLLVARGRPPVVLGEEEVSGPYLEKGPDTFASPREVVRVDLDLHIIQP